MLMPCCFRFSLNNLTFSSGTYTWEMLLHVSFFSMYLRVIYRSVVVNLVIIGGEWICADIK